VSDINTAVVDSLKVLDPKRPIREADMPASEGKGRVSNLAFSLSLLRTARTAGIDLPSDLPIRGRQHPGGTA